MDIISLSPPPIVWVGEQFEKSGISHRVDFAGMHLTLGPPRGIQINYYDIAGDLVPNYKRVRVYPEDLTVEVDNYRKGQGYRKYWQPAGLYQRLYWPKVLGVDHVANMADITIPLFIAEGEKKALSLQSKLIELGIPASVCSVPGVTIGKDLQRELSTLPWKATVQGRELSRPTWLVFDFNDRGNAEADTRKGESHMISILTRLHADLMALRWEAEVEQGVQKIDDWLVAGGDLPAAIKASMEADFIGGDELMQHLLAINASWGFYEGEFVKITAPNRGLRLSLQKFQTSNAPLYTLIPTKTSVKKAASSAAWLEWPGRRIVEGFTSKPPALGAPLQEWFGPIMNLSPAWAPCEEVPFDLSDLGLIDVLLENFCEGHAHFKWLRQHIAHTLLFPHITTSQAVLLCGQPGTGKTMLFDTFKRLASPDMLGGLVRNIAMEKMERFNSQLANVVIALVEEPPKLQRGKDFSSMLKLIVGAKTFEMEGKGKDSIPLPTNVHLFVAMNLHYLTHTPPDDRRCNFFEGKEQIGDNGTGFAARYAKFAESPDFTNTWLQWCQRVDLSDYNPQLLGPVSRARLRAIGLSASREEDFFNSVLADRNVLTNADLHQMWLMAHPRSDLTITKLGIMLQESGWSAAEDVWIEGKNHKTRARLSWLKESGAEKGSKWSAQRTKELEGGAKYT